MRTVYRGFSFDIKHLLGSYSEYGDVANVPQQHPKLIYQDGDFHSVRGDTYPSKSAGYHTGPPVAIETGQRETDLRNSQEMAGGASVVGRPPFALISKAKAGGPRRERQTGSVRCGNMIRNTK